MNELRNPHTPTRTTHARYRAPRTWGGLALYAGFAALIPLTLFALAHPTVVAAAVAGLSAGLLARPLRHRLTRRRDQSRNADRPSSAVGHAATKE